jgi:hypothetical protein
MRMMMMMRRMHHRKRRMSDDIFFPYQLNFFRNVFIECRDALILTQRSSGQAEREVLLCFFLVTFKGTVA